MEQCRWSLTPVNSNTTVVVKQFPAAGSEARDCSVRLTHALAEQEGLWTCGARIRGRQNYTDAPPAKLSLLEPGIIESWDGFTTFLSFHGWGCRESKSFIDPRICGRPIRFATLVAISRRGRRSAIDPELCIAWTYIMYTYISKTTMSRATWTAAVVVQRILIVEKLCRKKHFDTIKKEKNLNLFLETMNERQGIFCCFGVKWWYSFWWTNDDRH